MCFQIYIFYSLVWLLLSSVATRAQDVLDHSSSTQHEQIETLRELAEKDHLGSIIWKITNKYSIFNPNNTDDDCLEELTADHTLTAPYLINVTLNESQTFLDEYTELEFYYSRSKGNQLGHAYDLYENHTQIIQDQDEYLSAVKGVLEKLETTFNKCFLCPPNSTCGCVETEVLEKYEIELSRFRENHYALWEYIAFGTYIDPVFRTFMILIGVLLNGTVVYIFIKDKSIRRESNALVFNLVVNNLIMLLIYIPMNYVYKSHRAVLSDRLAFYLIQIIVISASATTTLILNIQRYVDVCRIVAPSVGGCKLNSQGRTIAYVASVWVWTMTITLLTSFAEVDNIIALEFSVYLLIYIFIYSILHAVFSALTSRKLQRAAERGQISTELKYITSSSVCVSLIVAFYLVHLPFFIFVPFDRLEGERSVQYFYPTVVRVLGFVFYQLLFTYPSVNALIMYKASSEFRRSFQKHLCKCWQKSDEGEYLTMSSFQRAEAQE